MLYAVEMNHKKEQQVGLLGGMLLSGATYTAGPTSAAAAREIKWVTGDDVTVIIPWPEHDGPWFLKVDLAEVDGRAQIVGLHVQSYIDGFDEHGQPLRIPGPHGLAEVTHAVVRGLKMGQIAESARHMFLMTTVANDLTSANDPEIKERIAQQLLELTNRGMPRRRRPAADDRVLTQVAELYREAIAAGGEPSRKPAKYIEDKLQQAGLQMDGAAVRKLIARARSRGLLAPATPRRPGFVTPRTVNPKT
jgi:hypothetical protein